MWTRTTIIQHYQKFNSNRTSGESPCYHHLHPNLSNLQVFGCPITLLCYHKYKPVHPFRQVKICKSSHNISQLGISRLYFWYQVTNLSRPHSGGDNSYEHHFVSHHPELDYPLSCVGTCSVGRNRTSDLRVMSPPSYRCSTTQFIKILRTFSFLILQIYGKIPYKPNILYIFFSKYLFISR